MITSNLLPIAKEGWGYILYSLAFFILSFLFEINTLSFILFLSVLFFAYSFRNPERELCIEEEKSVLSPVDAVLLSIDELDNNEYFYKVTFDSRYSDVSILRMPMLATVEVLSVFNGARLCLNTALGKKINANTSLTLKDAYGNKMLLNHIVKQSFCGIMINKILSSRLRQSKRYGVMVNGITEVYFPKNFRLNVKVGDEVKASQTLLGYFY